MRPRILKRRYSSLPFGHRVFVVTTLVCVVFTFVAAVGAIPFLSPWIVLVNAIGAAGYGVLAYLAFFRRRFTTLFWPFVGFTMALLVLQQINHAGFDGSMPVIFILAVVAVLAIADARRHRAIALLFFTVLCGLYALEFFRPDILRSYPGEAERRFDVFMAAMLCFLGAWAVVGGLRNNFERERRNLQRVNQRLRQTARELRRAQKSTEQAARARKSFLSTMSHEIRTPLNSIIGLAHLIRPGGLAEEDRNALGTIRFSAEHLLHLVNDILDYSQLESGIVEPESVPIEIAGWLNELLDSFRPAARENHTELELRLPPNSPGYVYGDPARLTQLFNNLIANAVKFTEKGSVSLVVVTRALSETAWDVTFEVRDTGVGIPADRLPSIFQEFTQAEADTFRKFGGTGLGLAIVRRLVHLFDGELRVESAPGAGSRFFVDLSLPVASPLKIGMAGKEPATPAPRLPGQAIEDGSRLTGKRVLLVEDFEMNRLIAERFLRRWGMEVFSVENGADAVAFFEREMARSPGEPCEVVLMDIQMPGLDGYETTRLIRACGGVAALVPIIALTAAFLPEERNEAYASGMNDYVAKPFRPEELQAVLLRNLARAS